MSFSRKSAPAWPCLVVTAIRTTTTGNAHCRVWKATGEGRTLAESSGTMICANRGGSQPTLSAIHSCSGCCIGWTLWSTSGLAFATSVRTPRPHTKSAPSRIAPLPPAREDNRGADAGVKRPHQVPQSSRQALDGRRTLGMTTPGNSLAGSGASCSQPSAYANSHVMGRSPNKTWLRPVQGPKVAANV